MDKQNEKYCNDDHGVLFDKSKTILIQVPGAMAGAYSVPNSVTTISEEAFRYCANLTSVTIPDSVTTIGRRAFEFCTSLTSVTVGNGVVSIGYGAFWRCMNLTKIAFQNSAPKIERDAFKKVTATAYYPAGDDSWTDDVKQGYGGNITWIPYTNTPPVEVGPVLRGVASRAAALTASAQSEPNQRYLLVVARDGSAPDLLSASNLLFCDQQRSSETGAVSFSYLPISGVEKLYVAIYGPECVTVLSDQSAQPSQPCDGGDNCPGKVFTDMPAKGNWAHDAIDWAIVSEITNGTSETTFSPNQGCTRAQVVTFLWRAAGCPEPTGTNNPFKDVKEGTYFYKAVLWAIEKGITNGTSADTFSPSNTCTRAQIVTFLWRYEGGPEPQNSSNPFADVTGGYYYKAVLWAVENGVTNGTSANNFSPNSTCTRAQIVTFLHRDLVA